MSKRVGRVKQISNSEISKGHNSGAIWSYRGFSTTVGTARTGSCSGKDPMGPGAWGFEKKLKHMSFYTLFDMFGTKRKNGEVGLSCSV